MNIMTKRGSLDNVVTYEHVCDTTADLQHISSEYTTLGSIALVLQGNSGGIEVYIATSNKEWIPITIGTGSGNGGVNTSNDTVTAATLLSGVTAHDRTGQEIIGEIISRTITDLQHVDNSINIPAGYYASPIMYSMDNLPIANENDVIFIDYDGTIRYSYSKEEFLALQELPANPTHNGLTAQGWNWTLTDAQTTIQERSKLAIGQNYITDNGQTRIYINIPEQNLAISLCLTLNGTANISWGDNSEITELTTTSNTTVSAPHTYTNKGEYVITITITGSAFFYGSGSTGSNLIIDPNLRGTDPSYFFLSLVKKVQLGANMTIGYKGLMYCNNLLSISIPLTGLNTKMQQYSFEGCTSLKALVIPPSVTQILLRACTQASNLKYVALSNTQLTRLEEGIFSECQCLSGYYTYLPVSSTWGYIPFHCFNNNTFDFFEFSPNISHIESQGFYDSRRLRKLILPQNVTEIGADAFYRLSSLRELHFLSPYPPILANATVFYNLSPYCTIFVPEGSLSTYTTATNYPNASTYTYVEE